MEKLIFAKNCDSNHHQVDNSKGSRIVEMSKLLSDSGDGSLAQKTSFEAETGQESSIQSLNKNEKSLNNSSFIETKSGLHKNFAIQEKAENNSSDQGFWLDASVSHAFPVTRINPNVSPIQPTSCASLSMPVTSLSEVFSTAKYLSRTPDRPENYTLTELTSLTPNIARQETSPHFFASCNSASNVLSSKTSNILDHELAPLEVQKQCSRTPSGVSYSGSNLDEMPLVLQPQPRIISPNQVITKEYLGANILKVSGQNGEYLQLLNIVSKCFE